MESRKFDAYLLSPIHPDGKHKLRLWRSIFGIGEDDGVILERLIRNQLHQAEPVEKAEKVDKEDPSKVYRRWELVIPSFKGPKGDVAPVLTAWALSPGDERPHLTTAHPEVD